MNFRLIIYLTFLAFVAVVITACAKIGYPVGGPKDITPPKLVSATPPSKSVNFKGKKVKLVFDEFIQFADMNKAFVSSPPMKKKPTVVDGKDKTVTIEMKEDLKPNTTYRFYFGNAIVDLNEKNQLKKFSYVLSTGPEVDTLALRGRVTDAFDHKPEKEGVYVMLYSIRNDTMPRKQLPDYIARTDAEGWFTMGNIRRDTFMIFALKDLNQNMLFDQPTETIAFSDTVVALNRSYFIPDSILNDTTTLDSVKRLNPFKPQIKLYSFAEDHLSQYLKKYDRPVPEMFNLYFNRKLHDIVKIAPLNFPSHDWFVANRNVISDTMSYWITDTALVHQDTLRLKLAYPVMDSTEKYVLKYDTISLINKKKVTPRKKRSGDKQVAVRLPSFKMSSSTQTNPTLDLNVNLMLTAAHPIFNLDKKRMALFKFEEKDTLPMKFTVTHDSIYLLRYWLSFKKEPKARYNLILDSLAFQSIYGEPSDSTGYSFQTQADDYYGTIKMNLTKVKGPTIVQIVNTEGKVVTQKFINHDQAVTFDFLQPGKYTIKVIYDRNSNGVWDTGNFAKRQQPEKVLIYNKIISLRSNYDITENWELE